MEHFAHGAFAVGSGDMNDPNFFMRVSQKRQRPAHPLQAEGNFGFFAGV
jgi:hypothetical protein